MPLLKPIIDAGIHEVLSSAGILAPRQTESKDALKKALEKHGLGLDMCVGLLAQQLEQATKEETRRGLLETALKMNGAMKEDNTREAPQIVFQIQGENVNLQNIFAPERG